MTRSTKGRPQAGPFVLRRAWMNNIPIKLSNLPAIWTTLTILALLFATTAQAQKVITPQTERRSFTDTEIADGFFKVAFGAEYHLAGRTDGIRKYNKPVRVFIDNRAKPDRSEKLRTIIADIAGRVQNLDIAVTDDRSTASMVVTLVRDRNLQTTIASFYGRERARDIKRTMDPQCLSSFTKDDDLAIINSNVILTVDAGDFTFTDCAYEEILQALGPINDVDSVPWTTFNDNISTGRFAIYDQYLLNILYDVRIRPGMTIDDVKAVLPTIIPDVRRWVSERNRLPN